MKNPLVSVVMPVYNAEKYLSEAIESILNQSYKNFEFIIIDDCSDDDSFGIIKEFAKKDKRIKYFKNSKKLGLIKTLNKLITFAKSEFIARMDADDFSDKDRILKQLGFLLKNDDYLIVGSDIKIINIEGEIIGKRVYPHTDKEIRKTIFFKSPFAHPSVCIRAHIFKKLFYEEKFLTAEDYYLWHQILKHGKGSNLKDYLLYYRVSEEQTKSKNLKRQLNQTLKVQKIIFKESKKVPFLAYINHFLLKLLYFLPNKLVLELFKFFEFKKF